MPEIVRQFRIEVIIDTTKATHMETFDIMEHESIDDLFERAKEYAKENLPKYE